MYTQKTCPVCTKYTELLFDSDVETLIEKHELIICIIDRKYKTTLIVLISTRTDTKFATNDCNIGSISMIT